MDHSKYYLKLAQNSKGSDKVARRTRTNVSETPVMRPALTPEAKENQMISLAMHCAEKQMREGTASSQVITHFLKLGTEKAKLEREKLRQSYKKATNEADKTIIQSKIIHTNIPHL